ncbi:MAG: sigma-54-dependent transcriptional regulator [Acidobacteriota bacterium]
MAEQRILVVDDDPNILEVLETRLEAHGYTVDTAAGGEQAVRRLRACRPDLVITDLKMPGMDGLALVERMQDIDATIPTIFLTAHGSIPDAVRAMKLGAKDFLVKPYSGTDLMDMVRGALAGPQGAAQGAVGAGGGWDENEEIVGNSAPIRRVLDLMARVGPSPSGVLITGESGTGKELVARTLHRCSPRAAAPYVVIDCGALPDALLESELFGHRKGAFTSATQDKKGLLEVADTGTVFLDEIGNISRPLQSRLLRFLQNGEVRRIGDVTPRRVDVRVLAASNRDLVQATEEGLFRTDLFYRLKVVTVHLPPLRERAEDIPVLAEIFLASSSRALGRPPARLSGEALEALCGHTWPGNVRELKHVIEASVTLAAEPVLTVRELRDAGFPWGAAEAKGRDEDDGLTALARAEKEQILAALRDHEWVQKRAAEALGISGRVIHYKIRKYGIRIPPRP